MLAPLRVYQSSFITLTRYARSQDRGYGLSVLALYERCASDATKEGIVAGWPAIKPTHSTDQSHASRSTKRLHAVIASTGTLSRIFWRPTPTRQVMKNPDELEPLNPEEAVEMYKHQRESEVSEDTLQSHGYRLKHFIRWCDNEDIHNLNNVGGRDIHRFRLWRSEQVNQTTLKSQMDTLRVFIRFCESIDGTRDGLAESIQSPPTDRTPVREKDVVREEKASTILEHLSKYEYASMEHTVTRRIRRD
jgi:hypothetical protein